MKSGLGIGQRVMLYQVRDVKAFCRIALEEFLSRGDVEKQLLDFYLGPAGPRDVAYGDKSPAVEFDLRAFKVRFRLRAQKKSRDCRDRRQRLAAKAQRGYRFQIVNRAQLRRGVSLEGQY